MRAALPGDVHPCRAQEVPDQALGRDSIGIQQKGQKHPQLTQGLMRRSGLDADLKGRPGRDQHKDLSESRPQCQVAANQKKTTRPLPGKFSAQLSTLGNDPERPRHTEDLAQHGRPGSAGNPQRRNRANSENQNRVQDDVDQTHSARNPERGAHGLQPAQDAKRSGYDETGHNAEQANVKIGLRIRLHDGIRAHPDGKALDSRPGDERQPQPQENGEQHAQAGHPANLLRFSRAHGLRHFGLGANAQKVEDPEEAGQQRGRRAKSSRRGKPRPAVPQMRYRPGWQMARPRERP